MIGDITAVILAGGLATRLGGVDKGLQPFRQRPLIEHVLDRLTPQVGAILINCNRHTERYAAYGLPLIPDRLTGFPGPLAGLHAALHAATRPLVLTVPCDAPFIPDDLAARLLAALADGEASVACTPARQPVFALYRRLLLARLEAALAAGIRPVRRWQETLDCREADFSSHPEEFANFNSRADWPSD